MGAALEQNTTEGWQPIAFASQFLNSTEEHYSVNELELLGIVWSIDYFKYYLYGKKFTVVTYHRALLSILKEHRSNKSYNSRLSRWIDRLLPYNFTIEHMTGAKVGLVDYISRNPFARAKKLSTYDEHFVRTPQMQTSLTINSQISTKPLASQLLLSQKKVPFASQLTLSNSIVNPHLNPPSASQIPLQVRKSQSVLNNCKLNNSHSNNEFAAKEVQMSDSKECLSEQF